MNLLGCLTLLEMKLDAAKETLVFNSKEEMDATFDATYMRELSGFYHWRVDPRAAKPGQVVILPGYCLMSGEMISGEGETCRECGGQHPKGRGPI